jgi:DNA-binding NarL/FixJ family response regulator
MDQQSYNAVQQGLLVCLLEPEHEQRLNSFLNGLRRDPQWTPEQIDEIEANIRELLSGRNTAASSRSAADRPSRTVLSRREEEVIRLLALGYTGKEISASVALSAKTVETYKMRAMRKLRLESRADIVRFAQIQGWL